MELISSVDEEVSSSEAACSDDPCANDWLEEAICAAALADCCALAESSPTAWRSLRLVCRVTNSANPPIPNDNAINAATSQRLHNSVALACCLDSSAFCQTRGTNASAALVTSLMIGRRFSSKN